MTVDRIQYLQQQIARYDDQHAYKELFKGLYHFLYPFARTIVKEKETAEEVVSDVFIKVWEKRKQLEKVENLKVYLYVSTRNIAINYLDRQRRPRGFLLWNRFGHLDAARELIQAGEPVGQHVQVG